MQDFGFTAQSDWVEHVVAFSAQSREPRDNSFTIKFTRDHPGMTAQLDVEPVLANGRRPDFRLRFNVSASAADLERGFRQSIFGNLAKQHSGLVMDAKFRTPRHTGPLAGLRNLVGETTDNGK